MLRKAQFQKIGNFNHKFNNEKIALTWWIQYLAYIIYFSFTAEIKVRIRFVLYEIKSSV